MGIGKGNNLTKALVIIVVLVAIAFIAQFAFLYNIDSRLTIAKQDLITAQEETQTAQDNNNKLQTTFKQKQFEYKNALGRLSFLGDGSGKIAYLTFDDGPYEKNTRQNLETLKSKGAVGTWFCLADDENQTYLSLDMLKEIEAGGNAIGIHDWDQHPSYSYFKGTKDNYFLTDFDKTKSKLESKVGHELNICRFAGGSATIGYYNKANKTAIPQELFERGIQFFDWNISAGDADSKLFVNGSTPKDKIVSKVLAGAEVFAKTNSPICILMHDNPGKETTAQALPEIIDGLKKLGYTFDTLKNETPGFYQTNVVE